MRWVECGGIVSFFLSFVSIVEIAAAVSWWRFLLSDIRYHIISLLGSTGIHASDLIREMFEGKYSSMIINYYTFTQTLIGYSIPQTDKKESSAYSSIYLPT